MKRDPDKKEEYWKRCMTRAHATLIGKDKKILLGMSKDKIKAIWDLAFTKGLSDLEDLACQALLAIDKAIDSIEDEELEQAESESDDS